jgi:hypothetical protein
LPTRLGLRKKEKRGGREEGKEGGSKGEEEGDRKGRREIMSPSPHRFHTHHLRG